MRAVLNVMKMDFVMVRRRVRIPMLLLLLLVTPFALLIMPASSAFAALFSGLIMYTTFGMDERDHLARMYETLPIRRTHLIIGRFAAGTLAVLFMSLLAMGIGYAALALRLYAWLPTAYTAVVRAEGTGATVACIASIVFAVTCILTGYLYMMNFIFGKHRELITILVAFALVMLIFVPSPITEGMLFSMLNSIVNMDIQAPFFQMKAYLSGAAWMAVCCAFTVLLRGRSEYR